MRSDTAEAGKDSCANPTAAANPRARKTERRIPHLLRGETQSHPAGFVVWTNEPHRGMSPLNPSAIAP